MTDPADVAHDLAAALTAAWNAGDAEAFAARFAPDAEFINIFGMLIVGREAVAAQHARIFATIYKGTTVDFQAVTARSLAPEVIHAVISGRLEVREGPMAGVIPTLINAVLVRDGQGWSVAAFHNTRVAPPPA